MRDKTRCGWADGRTRGKGSRSGLPSCCLGCSYPEWITWYQADSPLHHCTALCYSKLKNIFNLKITYNFCTNILLRYIILFNESETRRHVMRYCRYVTQCYEMLTISYPVSLPGSELFIILTCSQLFIRVVNSITNEYWKFPFQKKKKKRVNIFY